MRTLIIVLVLALILFFIFRSPKIEESETIPEAQEGLLNVDLSLGDENGEPLPQ